LILRVDWHYIHSDPKGWPAPEVPTTQPGGAPRVQGLLRSIYQLTHPVYAAELENRLALSHVCTSAQTLDNV